MDFAGKKLFWYRTKKRENKKCIAFLNIAIQLAMKKKERL